MTMFTKCGLRTQVIREKAKNALEFLLEVTSNKCQFYNGSLNWELDSYNTCHFVFDSNNAGEAPV